MIIFFSFLLFSFGFMHCCFEFFLPQKWLLTGMRVFLINFSPFYAFRMLFCVFYFVQISYQFSSIAFTYVLKAESTEQNLDCSSIFIIGLCIFFASILHFNAVCGFSFQLKVTLNRVWPFFSSHSLTFFTHSLLLWLFFFCGQGDLRRLGRDL